MSNAKPTILLLHGMYHPAAVWDQVIASLSGRGYRCLAPQLAFCGTAVPITSWKDCVDPIQKILTEETSAGRDVVVVAHSLSGIPGSNAVNGYTEKNPAHLKDGDGRVRGIVMISAMVIRDVDHYREIYKNPRSVANAIEGGWRAPPPNAKEAFYNDLAPADAEYWASKLMPNSIHLNKSVEGLYPGFKDVPVWYIACNSDMALGLAQQQEKYMGLIREVNPDLTVRHIDSGHSPLLSKPEETAAFIHEAAGEFAA